MRNAAAERKVDVLVSRVVNTVDSELIATTRFTARPGDREDIRLLRALTDRREAP